MRGAAARLREALTAADFTTSGVAALLGPLATAALSRNETVPARRATTGRTSLDTLVRLFLLQLPVDAAAAAAALPLDAAQQLGLISSDGTQVRARLDVRPYGEYDGAGPAAPLWWVVSDLGTGLDGHDVRLPDKQHVLGVGGASVMLAQLTPRDRVGTTIDLGTGCGVQALHASRHSDRVIATDISQRALGLAAITAALSGVELDLRHGSLLEPVRNEGADLVVTNPPFVVSPRGRHGQQGRYTYRDSGLPLDEVCARILRDAPPLLRPNGTLVMLANWVHLRGGDWRDRVGGWLPAHGVDSLVVQREVLDPAEYVEMWLRDSGETSGPGHLEAYDGWLAAFEEAGVEGVGLGFVCLGRTDTSAGGSAAAVLDWPHPVEQPLGPHLRAWLDRRAWSAAQDDDALLAARLRVADDVVQEQLGQPGAEDPEHLVLRRQGGMRPAVRVDSETAALVGASEGTLPLSALVAAVASVLGTDAEGTRERLIGQVRSLVDDGILEPVERRGTPQEGRPADG
ncbi:MAG: hypothetical protein QOE19_2032 [Actinomycetota bacterium]|nr:hypothetical protein [Actinomycetota bacterium]